MAGKVVFQADTSKFTQPVERSATVVRDLSKALKEQEKAARETYRDQIANAKAAGASVEELQRIEQERYRSLLALQAAQKQINAENVSNGKAAVNSAEAQKEAVDLVTRAYQEQLVAVNATFGEIKKQHAEVAGSIAGGAAIRTIDGGQNVRAVENFLAKTLGLGGALQALFPLVGGIAFIQILGEGAEKLYEMHKRAEEAGKALQTAFDEAHAKTSLTIDDLAIQADKLQLNIDKLKGHPGNGLQLGLDEAKKSADELLASLTADRKEIEALFKETHVGTIDAWFSGSNPTGAQEASIKKRQADYIKRIEGIETDVNGRYASTNSDAERKALDAERRRRIEQAMRDELTNVASERKDLVSGNTTIDVDPKTGQVSTNRTHQNDARIGQLDYYAQQVQSQLSLYQYRYKVADLIGQEQNLKGGKDSAGIASKASQGQRDQWETDLKEQQKYGNMTAAQERSFWAERVSAVKQGTDNWRFAYDKYLDAFKKVNEETRKQAEDLRKANEKQRADSLKQLREAIAPGAVAQSQGIIDASSSGRDLNNAKQNAANTVAEANIRYKEQIGLITQADAAIQLRNLHELQYSQQLAKLKEELAAVQTGPEADAQRNRINQRIVDLDARHRQQQLSDQLAVLSTARQAIDGVNQNLSSLMSGGKSNFGGLFRSIGQQFGELGLKNIEAPLLSKLGFGKADGSAANPFSVRIVDGVGGSIGSVASGISGKLGKVGGFISSIFGGFRATGGPVTAGNAYVVGENQAELFVPPTNGTIMPDTSMLGGTNHHWNIDARGATDPAAVDAAVRRGIAAAAPSLIGNSVRAMHEQKRRSPSTRTY